MSSLFQGANLLIQLTGAYSRYGKFRFTTNWIAKVYRANLAKGYHSTNFPSCKCNVFSPKLPGKSHETPPLCSDGGTMPISQRHAGRQPA